MSMRTPWHYIYQRAYVRMNFLYHRLSFVDTDQDTAVFTSPTTFAKHSTPMISFNSRSTAILLLLVALATCARANPNGGTFDGMDWSWDLFDSVGGQFAASLVASNQLNTMVRLHNDSHFGICTDSMPKTSSSMAASHPITASRRRPSPPRSQPHPNVVQAPAIAPQPDYFSFTNLELAGIWESQSQSRDVAAHTEMSLHAHSAPSDQRQPHISTAANRLFRPQYQQSISRELDQAAGIAAQSPQPTRGQRQSLDSSNMYGYPGAPQVQATAEQWTSQAHHQVNDRYNRQQSTTFINQDFQTYPRASVEAELMNPTPLLETPFCAEAPHLAPQIPQILPLEVTSNPNYQPGMMNGVVGNMQGWAKRAPAIGNHTALSINTTHLAPPDDFAANRSPTSASTTESSTRPGSRRSREEMMGNFVCGYCKAGFPTQGELTHHLRSHAPYMSRQHVCSICEKRFQYKKDLGRHAPKHDPNRKKYYCSYQGCKYFSKGFGRQDHLDRHLATQHRVDTPQQVSQPSFSFA